MNISDMSANGSCSFILLWFSGENILESPIINDSVLKWISQLNGIIYENLNHMLFKSLSSYKYIYIFCCINIRSTFYARKNIFFFDVYTLFFNCKNLHFPAFLKQHVFPFNIMSHTLVHKGYVFFQILPFVCWWSYQDPYKVLGRQGRERHH